MSSLAGINELNAQQQVNYAGQKTAFGNAPQSQEKKSNSTTNKILIGAGAALAVTGSVIGGIMYAKKAKFNKVLNEIKDSLQLSIKVKKSDSVFSDKFDMSKVDEELAEAVAEAKKTKNLDKLKKMQTEYRLSDFMFNRVSLYSLDRILKESDTISAKALKKALAEKGDFRDVKRWYFSEFKNAHQRYNVKHSPADGKNLQETIDVFTEKGLLPKGVKPHTYGADEMDLATTNYTYGGGYTEYMVRKNHISEKQNIAVEDAFLSYNPAPQRIKSTNFNSLVSSFKDKSAGVDVVTLKLPKVGINDTYYYIAAGNKSGKLTPLQKDLIEVGGRLNDDELKIFADILHYQENMDYDAILSLIQHYAKDAEFMARPVK